MKLAKSSGYAFIDSQRTITQNEEQWNSPFKHKGLLGVVVRAMVVDSEFFMNKSKPVLPILYLPFVGGGKERSGDFSTNNLFCWHANQIAIFAINGFL